ncbi:Fucose-1-phosphate guanylyltransferase [Toxocara canis]|uniref:Fucose-1-phosphate guanylyltransferase n=2 Tax=Toxocara canis TaxID=6265 RepID=A0A0B2VZS4_TOXCA|nr:Fucose-1-phosphate guanylyltransferase [Toxocara canis]VDM39930.1 unnamed protein product [Toxocara canis]
MKWDAVVLTARDLAQKQAFEAELADLFYHLNEFGERFIVYEDQPQNIRIGSGGATLRALYNLREQFGESFSQWRAIIIHSGGLSQRLPSASALGKVFMLLPNAKTFLEMKLRSYRPVLEAMEFPGVVVCASDTLEYIPSGIRIGVYEITLFAHVSTIEVAREHGVYVLEEGHLCRVLQKPTDEELWLNDALIHQKDILPKNGNVGLRNESEEATEESKGQKYALTDSFFILSGNIINDLIELVRNIPIECETCCYGDFLRALGTSPSWNYLEVAGPLARARRVYADVFRHRSTEVVQLPKNSFFHFGTVSEVLTHFSPSSIFISRFQMIPRQCIYSITGPNFQIGERSIIEFCDFRCGAHIGSDCVISGCSSTHHVIIPDRVIASTIAVKPTTSYSTSLCSKMLYFVTIAFSLDDNLKTKSVSDGLCWFSHVIKPKSSHDTLWNMPLFRVCTSASESLDATLYAITNGPPPMASARERLLLSMADALRTKNVLQMLKYRRTTKRI